MKTTILALLFSITSLVSAQENIRSSKALHEILKPLTSTEEILKFAKKSSTKKKYPKLVKAIDFLEQTIPSNMDQKAETATYRIIVSTHIYTYLAKKHATDEGYLKKLANDLRWINEDNSLVLSRSNNFPELTESYNRLLEKQIKEMTPNELSTLRALNKAIKGKYRDSLYFHNPGVVFAKSLFGFMGLISLNLMYQVMLPGNPHWALIPATFMAGSAFYLVYGLEGLINTKKINRLNKIIANKIKQCDLHLRSI